MYIVWIKQKIRVYDFALNIFFMHFKRYIFIIIVRAGIETTFLHFLLKQLINY